MLFFVSFSFVLLVAVNAGGCPSYTALDNFDFKSFVTGRWYEIGRYPGYGPEKGAKCATLDYITEGDDIHVVVKELIDNKPVVTKMLAQRTSSAGNIAEMRYSYDTGSDIISVLDTDYESYAIYYACTMDEATNTPQELAWVDSRSPTISPEAKAKVDKFMENHPFIDPSRIVYDSFTHEECLQYI